MDMNNFIRRYYQHWLVHFCEIQQYVVRTRYVSSLLENEKQYCKECKSFTMILEYSHSDLFNQIKLYKYIFDSNSIQNTGLCDPGNFFFSFKIIFKINFFKLIIDVLKKLEELKDFVDTKYLKRNAYNFFNTKVLFDHNKKYKN